MAHRLYAIYLEVQTFGSAYIYLLTYIDDDVNSKVIGYVSKVIDNNDRIAVNCYLMNFSGRTQIHQLQLA